MEHENYDCKCRHKRAKLDGKYGKTVQQIVEFCNMEYMLDEEVRRTTLEFTFFCLNVLDTFPKENDNIWCFPTLELLELDDMAIIFDLIQKWKTAFFERMIKFPHLKVNYQTNHPRTVKKTLNRIVSFVTNDMSDSDIVSFSYYLKNNTFKYLDDDINLHQFNLSEMSLVVRDLVSWKRIM